MAAVATSYRLNMTETSTVALEDCQSIGLPTGEVLSEIGGDIFVDLLVVTILPPAFKW